MRATPDIRVQPEPFDAARECAAISTASNGIGALVTFTGLCRNEGGRLAALELQHYAGMAEAQMRRIADEACDRWPLDALAVIHRHGLIRPGEGIVLVIAAAAHRRAAFEAADFMMDYLKTSAPFWKREHLADGTLGGWVAANEADDDATARWQGAADR